MENGGGGTATSIDIYNKDGVKEATVTDISVNNDLFDNLADYFSFFRLLGPSTYNGGAGGDFLLGSQSVDTLNGGGGNDTLQGQNVDGNFMNGDAGDDLIYMGAKGDVGDGGTGIDTAEFRFLGFEGAAYVDGVLVPNNLTIRLDTSRPQDTGGGIMVTVKNIENAIGGEGNDTITGTRFNNKLEGGLGQDTLNGGLGDDTYVLRDQQSVIFDTVFEIANGGTDTIEFWYGVNNTYVLPANVENIVAVTTGVSAFTFTGNELANSITGGAAADVLNGLAGDDRLTGFTGIDELYGGVGNDTLIGGAGADKLDGGEDFDTVDYSTGVSSVTVNLGTGVGSFGEAAGDTYTSIERVIGTTQIDTMIGSAQVETFIGGLGADKISAGGGNDTLSGGDGADVLNGGRGADRITGGAGADRIVFGTLQDSTVTATGRDTIFGFSRAEGDKLDLRTIDASTAAANDQAFTFIGTAAFTGVAGQLRTMAQGTSLFVLGDVNGDNTADFGILLDSTASLAAGDFLL